MRFVGRRLTLTATFLTFGKTQTIGGKRISFMLVEDVRRDGQWLADHVWIPLRPGERVTSPIARGDEIKFSAEVEAYCKGSLKHRKVDYGLCRPRDVERVEQMDMSQSEGAADAC